MATILTDPRASGASHPIPADGFKVDISRGERIGRVSSEWFSRPDDERYLSLSALHDAVLRRAERAIARTVETREVRVEVAATMSKALLWSCRVAISRSRQRTGRSANSAASSAHHRAICANFPDRSPASTCSTACCRTAPSS